LDHSGASARSFGAGKQPVFLAQSNGANAIFSRVVVDGEMACFGITLKKSVEFIPAK
jgi:hypothetical protein